MSMWTNCIVTNLMICEKLDLLSLRVPQIIRILLVFFFRFSTCEIVLLPKFPLHSLLNLPAQIIQSYAGECPSNSIYCLTLQDQVTKTYNWHKCCKYYREDKYASQCSGAPSQRQGAPLHWQANLSVGFPRNR